MCEKHQIDRTSQIIQDSLSYLERLSKGTPASATTRAPECKLVTGPKTGPQFEELSLKAKDMTHNVYSKRYMDTNFVSCLNKNPIRHP